MLRRLDGVADVTAEVRTGTVAVTWRPSARLDLARLKAQFFAWRGAVRYGTTAAPPPPRPPAPRQKAVFCAWRGAVRYGTTAAVVTGSVRRDDQGWLLEASV